MARVDGVWKFYKNVDPSTIEQVSTVIPAGKSWAVSGISFLAPGKPRARAVLKWDLASPGPPPSKIFDGAHTDKFCQPKRLIFTGDGVKVLQIELINNDTLASFLGCTVYYEELG